MTGRSARRRALRAGAIVVAASTALTAAPGMASGAETVTPVLEGLVGPRGLWADASGRALIGEADGTVTFKTKGPATRTLTKVPPAGIAPAVSRKAGNTFILTVAGEPGSGAASLYRYRTRDNDTKLIADIAAHQVEDPDPDNLEGAADESNPFDVAALKGGLALVADAAGNDLLRVFPNGDIETVARLKPRVVEAPPEFAGNPELPPPGTPIPAEGVATSVTVGADGYYYVGELRGFPATPGTSEVWRIAPDAVGAVCDPENPTSGDCQLYADGFTSIVDLAAGRDGSIYVLEVAKSSWFQVEAGLADPIGGLFRIAAPGAEPVELAADQLFAPGGIDVTSGTTVWVTSPIIPAGPGALLEVTG